MQYTDPIFCGSPYQHALRMGFHSSLFCYYAAP